MRRKRFPCLNHLLLLSFPREKEQDFPKKITFSTTTRLSLHLNVCGAQRNVQFQFRKFNRWNYFERKLLIKWNEKREKSFPLSIKKRMKNDLFQTLSPTGLIVSSVTWLQTNDVDKIALKSY